jgi:hypothetical protein
LGGEPYRVLALDKDIDRQRAISSVILYNMIRWLAHFIFWLSAAAIALVTMKLTPSLFFSLLGVCVVLISLVMFFLARHKNGIFESLLAWMARNRLLRRYAQKLEPHRAALLSLDTQITQLYQHHRRTFYTSIALEYISRVIASFEFLFILKALGFTPAFLEALYINAATSFILNMLFFVPFELGTREGGLYVVMESIGYTQGIGVFIGLVNRLREFFWTLIGMALMLKTERTTSAESFLEMMEEKQGS